MNLLLAIALAGVIESTPTKVCTDACGNRVGCLTPEAAVEGVPLGERPAYCPPPAARIVPVPPPKPPNPFATVCIDGVVYFERTLTPKLRRNGDTENCDG